MQSGHYRERGAGRAVTNDLILGVLGLAFTAFAWWMLRDLPQFEGFRVGAGYMPRIVLAGIGLISLILVVRGFGGHGERPESFSLRPLLLVCLALILFALSIESLGIVVASAVAVFVCAAAAYDFRPVQALILSVAVTACAIMLFTVLLGLPIKVWP
ncbi:putative Tripartite tricarboxylate transporter TctB family protein [Hyphomicrobiales bacterium]|nr:putative Tripartite tricarboxylate transporter TctB family protein [Hyphomicrobiales bacterium]CAH1691465.1 membrane hypothetical protein [Hyphomicrobiales bacterium]